MITDLSFLIDQRYRDWFCWPFLMLPQAEHTDAVFRLIIPRRYRIGAALIAIASFVACAMGPHLGVQIILGIVTVSMAGCSATFFKLEISVADRQIKYSYSFLFFLKFRIFQFDNIKTLLIASVPDYGDCNPLKRPVFAIELFEKEKNKFNVIVLFGTRTRARKELEILSLLQEWLRARFPSSDSSSIAGQEQAYTE